MIDREKLLAFKHAVQNEIKNKYGSYAEVQIQQQGVRRLQELFVVSIIPNGNIFHAQMFEIYQDRLGNIYWGDYQGNFNENMTAKVVN